MSPIPPTLGEQRNAHERLGYNDTKVLVNDQLWLVERNARVIFQPDGTTSVTIGGFSRRRDTLRAAVDELRVAIIPAKAK